MDGFFPSYPVYVSVWGCVYTRELYLHNNRLSVISKEAFTNLASLQVTPYTKENIKSVLSVHAPVVEVLACIYKNNNFY